MTFYEHVRDARTALVAAGIPDAEAALDAELLARHALNIDRATWILRMRDAATPAFTAAFASLIDRRTRREPVAYIRGVQEFWGRDFAVSPAVLIPRPETELIVEEALTFLRGSGVAQPAVLDIGVGSGCLAITLALEHPAAVVHGTDVSPDALAIARRNAERWGAPVTLHHGPITAGLSGPWDLIVSNPPYITTAAYTALQPEVRNHEPVLALVGGDDGLDVIRAVVRAGREQLREGGLLLIECGHDQAAAVAALVTGTEGLRLLRVRDDLQGVPRMVIAVRDCPSARIEAR
ncbi:MAG: peptide chain release factor N(5)-glutamine methyltransferase [Acidobacteria bacterium]|nr:peptide chain release factor N(5)-glutamine methyltransferase [Acidobacteriota bacterium]